MANRFLGQKLYACFRKQRVFSLTNMIEADLNQLADFVTNFDQFKISNDIIRFKNINEKKTRPKQCFLTGEIAKEKNLLRSYWSVQSRFCFL